MKNPYSDSFETRYEWLRPAQLKERRDELPLAILPLGPLEYHGPHMIVGMDPLNATFSAHAACARLKKGVVLPTLYAGTERERDTETLSALGFKKDDWVVGMDFPTRLWNSHYLPEEVFALTLLSELRILVGQGYKYIFICGGHGAVNHNRVIERLCKEVSNTTAAKMDFTLVLPEEMLRSGAAGHADIVETSIMMNYEIDSIDLSQLPPKDVQIKYSDFSIVDGVGFTAKHDPNHILHPNNDPRSATPEKGKEMHETVVTETVDKIKNLCNLK